MTVSGSVSKPVQTRIIFLEEGAHLESVVIRLCKGWIVRFVRGASLLGRDVRLTTSLSGELKWSDDADDLAACAQVVCTKAGAFSYEFFVDGNFEKASGSGYLQIAPELEVAGRSLPLDSVICQTHLAKLLGPLPEWEDRLRVAKESGYNMIHFTPVHELGISNSSYSIANPLRLNPAFSTATKKYTLNDVGALVEKMAKEWGVLSIQDVVWNHAAKNADWLEEHPECAYNCANSPHLRPAYVMDRLYYHFSREIADGKWTDQGLPPFIENDQHLEALRRILTEKIVPRVRLEEFFKIDVEKTVKEFEEIVKRPSEDTLDENLPLEVGKEWTRFGFTLDMQRARRIFNRNRGDACSEEDRQYKCIEALRNHLHHLNKEADGIAADICAAGVNAALGHVAYERVNPQGPRRRELTETFPLLTTYFLHKFPSNSWEEDEHYAYDEATAKHLMAFNGWVMNDDPLRNFALYPSQVYLRRELVCWGDCVKLRYGDKPEDCPFLWNMMKEYSQTCARIFHGVRIDNCHSTPIHVAEYLLKAAREVRPDLYVVAELFTGGEQLDNIFVNRLGITSLIREAQNAPDSHEQGRLVYRFGGDVVGAFIQRPVQPASSIVAHALLYDQTHDNPSPIEKRSVYDTLPTSAMVAMASCSNGSTRGYDELLTFKVDVVKEKRLYAKWGEVNAETGIIGARAVINKLHTWLGDNNYTQVFVDQMNFDIVAITRHNPKTHDTVVLVAHTAFKKDAICLNRPPVRDVYFQGSLDEILFEAQIHAKEGFEQEMEGLNYGLRGYSVMLREHVKPEDSVLTTVHLTGNGAEGGGIGHIELTNFVAGSVIAFKISPPKPAVQNIAQITKMINGGDMQLDKELHAALERLSVQSFNRVLFRCEAEEQDDYGSGTYHIPNFGSFVYCGLQGLMPVLNRIREKNDLGHPLCGNLRDGVWLCEYIVKRLTRYEPTKELGLVIERMFEPLKEVQYYLRPCYFEAIFSRIYNATLEELKKKLHPSLLTASKFVRALALSSVSFVGAVESAKLSPLSTSIHLSDRLPSSLAAGLPHFAVGIWRNWGRDTFIALPGCLLVTGRYDDARNLIVSYGGAMRHGLVPNLLAEGQTARYNCRDAVWFWLYAIVKYIQKAPNGIKILTDRVRRLYPHDDAVYGADEKEEELHETMYDALQRHFQGICFRERNAGPQIDEHITDSGFNVSAYVNLENGFIYGGNQWNCGTWMDKMGSSERAGNRGQPATPRDGAAVELQGLAYAVVEYLDILHQKGHFPYDGTTKWSWREWAQKIKGNFERCFFVDEHDETRCVNRRFIVKDTYGSTFEYTDYQLRPNFAIALAVAPKLMSAKNAWSAICIAEKELLGPLGIKTLDPKDWNYDGFYNNDDDSIVKKTAKGWNYHQGPEWVWVAGYFLRAKLSIAKELNDPEVYDKAVRSVRARMGLYWQHVQESAWRSLPELTNEGGAFCAGSCPAQAWSVGCLLETVDQLYNYH
uniref:Glycogen debranching enzyme n=1 Tax=Anisakis simplex TaxID=6269 RepID=A0A1L5SM67_ANISI|nr:glycogen-debranching enzyme [Anisakis simplex]